ncbi:MAG: hypothetical protein ACHP9Y_06145, partial [Gammaproteobacteria bacterium]
MSLELHSSHNRLVSLRALLELQQRTALGDISSVTSDIDALQKIQENLLEPSYQLTPIEEILIGRLENQQYKIIIARGGWAEGITKNPQGLVLYNLHLALNNKENTQRQSTATRMPRQFMAPIVASANGSSQPDPTIFTASVRNSEAYTLDHGEESLQPESDPLPSQIQAILDNLRRETLLLGNQTSANHRLAIIQYRLTYLE